jgi:hypothetical protein
MTELEGKKEEIETAKKIVHTYPLIRVNRNHSIYFVFKIYIFLLENLVVTYVKIC